MLGFRIAPGLVCFLRRSERIPKIVLVVLMRGQSSAIKGAMAAGVAGRIYRRLNDENYFGQRSAEVHPNVTRAGFSRQ